MEQKELRDKLRKIIELSASVTTEHSNPKCIGDVWGRDCVCGKIEDIIDDAVKIMQGDNLNAPTKPFYQDSISFFNEQEMKIVCVLAINKDNDVGVSVHHTSNKDQIKKYLEGAMKTLNQS